MSTTYISSFKSLANQIICEARLSDLEYTEKRVKDVLTEVTAKATGPLATKVNRLYEGIESRRELIKKYQEETDGLTAEARKMAADFFDEDDKVLTRVITSNKCTIKFSKVVTTVTTKEKKDVEKLEKLVNDIGALLIEQNDELSSKIKEMIKNCEYVSTVVESKTSPERVLTESVKSFIEKLAKKLSGFKDKIVAFIESFDKRQEKIDEMLKEAKA